MDDKREIRPLSILDIRFLAHYLTTNGLLAFWLPSGQCCLPVACAHRRGQSQWRPPPVLACAHCRGAIQWPHLSTLGQSALPGLPSYSVGCGTIDIGLARTFPFSTKIRDFNINYVTPKMRYFCISLC